MCGSLATYFVAGRIIIFRSSLVLTDELKAVNKRKYKEI